MLAHVVVNVESVTWVDIGTLIGVALTFGAIEAGVVVAYVQLGRQAKISESEHLIGMLGRWSEVLLQDARYLVDSFKDGDEVLRAMGLYEDSHDQREFVLRRIPGFFEDLGILTGDIKVIEVRSVRNSMATSIRLYWEKFKPFIDKERKRQKADGKEPTAYEWFEKLKKDVS